MLNISFVRDNSKINQIKFILINKDFSNQNLNLSLTEKDLISKALDNKDQFSGKFGEVKNFTYILDNNVHNLTLIGTGDLKDLKNYKIEELGGKIFKTACSMKFPEASVDLGPLLSLNNALDTSALLANGALLASYRFNKHFTKNLEKKFYTSDLEIISPDIDKSNQIFKELEAVTLSVFIARDCISEPANILYPESYANIIANELEPLGVNIEIYGERDISNFGMNALLGVGQGSAKESKFVIMHYQGADSSTPTYSLVGKGITFDSGGISLKPSNNMWEMKYDMSGSAAVFGTLRALASRKAKVNVVGVVALVENMPGGNAQKPGDVVVSMSGQTIEVQDTDAEGRLVLADALWYVQEKFKPKWIIDLATLTGAIVVALGNTYAGCFTNENSFGKQLVESGSEVDEKLWIMPMHEDFNEMMNSDIADMNNISSGRGAGSSTAANFLGRFIQEGVTWAHLDIAGLAWMRSDSKAISPKGAVGFGVRLLNQFIKNNYEQK